LKDDGLIFGFIVSSLVNCWHRVSSVSKYTQLYRKRILP